MRLRPLVLAVLGALPTLAAAQQVKSGEWEIVTSVRSAEIPSAPQQAASMMKGLPKRIRRCLTAEAAASGPAEMMRTNKACKLSRYSRKGGKLDSQIMCSQPGGGTMIATSTGTYTATSFTTTARLALTAPQMKVTTVAEGKRIGACSR